MASTCSLCGTANGDDHDGEGPPLGWSSSATSRGVEQLCPGCTRAHVRDIEAKLEPAWWS